MRNIHTLKPFSFIEVQTSQTLKKLKKNIKQIIFQDKTMLKTKYLEQETLSSFFFYPLLLLSKVLRLHLKIACKLHNKFRFYKIINPDFNQPSLLCVFVPAKDYKHISYFYYKQIPIICFYDKRMLFQHLYILKSVEGLQVVLLFLFFMREYLRFFDNKLKSKSYTKKKIFFCLHTYIKKL